MDGTISLASELGTGSTVTITVSFPKAPLVDVVDFVGTMQDVPIPTKQEAAKMQRAEEIVEQNRHVAHAEDVRILLAEDNDLIRQIVTRTLKGKGVSQPRLTKAEPGADFPMQFSIDAVEDGRKCLEQLKLAEYDVVLMDVSRRTRVVRRTAGTDSLLPSLSSQGQMPHLDG